MMLCHNPTQETIRPIHRSHRNGRTTLGPGPPASYGARVIRRPQYVSPMGPRAPSSPGFNPEASGLYRPPHQRSLSSFPQYEVPRDHYYNYTTMGTHNTPPPMALPPAPQPYTFPSQNASPGYPTQYQYPLNYDGSASNRSWLAGC